MLTYLRLIRLESAADLRLRPSCQLVVTQLINSATGLAVDTTLVVNNNIQWSGVPALVSKSGRQSDLTTTPRSPLCKILYKKSNRSNERSSRSSERSSKSSMRFARSSERSGTFSGISKLKCYFSYPCFYASLEMLDTSRVCFS